MMKKKISLVLAFLMAASMLAGCKKTDENSAGITDTGITASEPATITQMTTTKETETETETETEETTEETTTTSAPEETTESETTTTTAPSETTIVSDPTTATAAAVTTKAAKEWNETEISETLYITKDCYSRVKAVVGSDSVKKYTAGTKINIVAATDTGYYKLADGTFIHSDYVTDTAPGGNNDDPNEEIFGDPEETTTKKPAQTEKTNPDTSKNTSSNPINTNYTKSYTDRYPYQQLSSAEKQLYRNIVEAAESFNTEVAIPDGLMSDDVFKVYVIVFNNEPQLFWLSNSVPSGYGSLSLKFEISRSKAEEMQKTIDSNVQQVMNKVNAYSSTVSKLKVIHDWVITKNTFSLQGNYATCGIYNGLTGAGELQCQGYAKTTQYLCDMAGIDCMTVVGNNSEGSTHAWNVVYCDNGYYILDTTWDDPENSYGNADFVRYLYFLANDSMIKNSHFNISTAKRGNGDRIKLYTPPACTKTACYYFKAYNKEYSDLDSAVNGMYAEFDDVIAAGKQVVHIRVTDHDTWETLTSDKYWKIFQDYARSKSKKVDNIRRQRILPENCLVVEYDIVYK